MRLLPHERGKYALPHGLGLPNSSWLPSQPTNRSKDAPDGGELATACTSNQTLGSLNWPRPPATRDAPHTSSEETGAA